MVRRWLGLISILLLLILAIGVPAAASSQPRVVDQAGLFTAAEQEQLAAEAQALGDQYQMDIVIVTTDDADGKSSQAYGDDFYVEHHYGVGADYDGILLLLDMDNREVHISTSGIAIRYLTDSRIESILDAVIGAGMAQGLYFEAAQAFLTATGNDLAAGIPDNQYTAPANSLTWPEGLIGLGVSVLSSLWFFAGTRSAYKGRQQNNIFDYHQNSLVNFGFIADDLANSTVTSRALPRNPTGGGSFGGGGRSSTHMSGGGRTFGGGGRRF
jgi:uncharacterized protein